MITDTLSGALLSIGHAPLIIPIICYIYWFKSKDEGRHLLYALLLSMVFNAALKVYFKVPLKPHMAHHNWYAFPSGHMQMVTVFYGTLFRGYRQRLALLWAVVPLLMAYGWALVHQNFHDYYDVWAGFGAGICVLAIYQWGCRTLGRQGLSSWLGFAWLIVALPLVLYVFYEVPQSVMHPWQALGGILGVSLGGLVAPQNHHGAFIEKAGRAGLGVLGFSALWFGNGLVLKSLGFPLFPFASFMLLGLWLGGLSDALWCYVAGLLKHSRA